MWGPQAIANLVYLPRLSMAYGRYICSIHGVYKPTNITWGANIFVNEINPLTMWGPQDS